MSKHSSIAHTSSRWNQAVAHPSTPVALVMLSDAAFTTMDGTAQLLGLRGVPVGQIVFGRMVRLRLFIFGWTNEPQLTKISRSTASSAFSIYSSANPNLSYPFSIAR